mgnify:CR=1 FL=1
MPLKIEVGNFYRTRDGEKAVCIAHQDNKGYPHVMAYMCGEGEIETVTLGGRVIASGTLGKDIVSEWEEPTVRYVNIYAENGNAVLHPTRESADKSVGTLRSACVRIEFYPGQLDD